MKKLYLRNNVLLSVTIAALLLFTRLNLSGQTTYSFTTAGATGMNGPTQTQVNTAYGSTNLNGLVTVSNGYQQFTVPQSGSYRIRAVGAQGGNNGGRGAYIAGDFTLTAGTVLKILVGQEGTTGNNGSFSAGGGGGGSFVTDMTNVPFVVAGGGGGNGGGYSGPGLPCCTSGMEASLTQNGRGAPSVGGTSGTAGGGGGCLSSLNAGGGAGITGDGSLCQAATTALSYVNGGTGGGPGGGSGQTGEGGFGGGGGGYSSGVGNRGGGGGGYSGGGGGSALSSETEAAGGGGGSFNGGANPTNSIVTSGGDGAVFVDFLCDVTAFALQNPICFGSAVTLSTNAGSNISWSTGPTTNTIMVSPTTNTSYTVTGTSSSTTACVASIIINVSVSPLPTIMSSVSPSILCVGSTATIMNTGAATYTLDSGTMGSMMTVNPVSTTVYTVSAHSSEGCFNTATVTVPVNTNSITVSPNSTICAGNSATLSASGAENYAWTVNGNSVPFQQITLKPTTSTVYSVSGVDIHGCTLSNTVDVDVRSAPVLTVSASSASVCQGEPVTISASGASSYTWNSGSGSSFTEVLTLDLPYHYFVTGSDDFGCTSQGSVTVLSVKCTGLSENKASTLRVYPNPSSGIFNVQVQGSVKLIELFNSLGELIESYPARSGGVQIDISGRPAGVYFLAISDSDGDRQLHKLIKN